MRYIVNAHYWQPNQGPILFYAGNEGDVWGFYNNSGFMTDYLAKNLKGLVVFAEHRYFGESWPFDKEKAFTAPYNSYLTLEQVMMDYVEFIKFIRYSYECMECPVIVFGGSYGGMLAAWLRMKYPHVFQGALASSAPILYFHNMQNEFGFFDSITASFKNVSANIPDVVKEGWNYLVNADATEYDGISTIFKTCKPIAEAADLQMLYEHLENGFAYMAMTNYPYPTSFLEPMPGWPVNETKWSFINVEPPSTNTTWERKSELFTAILNATNVYYNWTGQMTCTDFTDVEGTGNLDGAGWDVLACNQLAMPTGVGPNSMFIEDPFDYDGYTGKNSYCNHISDSYLPKNLWTDTPV